MAALVLSHRGNFRANTFKGLMTPFVKTGKHMCVLLRIAVLLHRGRANQPIPDIDITVHKKTINLKFPDGWLDNHNMTLADFIKEINYLDTAGYQLIFE